MIDVAAPAVAIGAAVGRIGCFLNGCCDGAVCSLPWAVRFPAGSHAWMRQANAGLISEGSPYRFPCIPPSSTRPSRPWRCSGLLLAYFPWRSRPGEVMALLMVLYSITRWPIEALVRMNALIRRHDSLADHRRGPRRRWARPMALFEILGRERVIPIDQTVEPENPDPSSRAGSRGAHVAGRIPCPRVCETGAGCRESGEPVRPGE